MTTVERKGQIVSGNGDATFWLEYVKRVRFQYERTEPKKRCLLGAELVSRLTGRAWDVASADIDHHLLQQQDGAAYLLRFLEDRLCKAPVPDTGQRLEDFFIRLRRQPGASMTEWGTQVREAYRRLQRAMARQRRDMEQRGEGPLGPSSPKSTPPVVTSSPPRRSDATTPHASQFPGQENPFGDVPRQSNPGSHHGDLDDSGDQDEPDHTGYQRVPQQDDASNAGSNPGRWTADEWVAWRAQRGWNWRRNTSSSSSYHGDDVDTKTIQWEQFDFGDIQILPPEILGWIMLRRSGLPASSRLSVLSAINNKLDLDTMERAMRDQEEELLLSEAHRRPDLSRPKRSFWIEEGGEWGLLSEADLEDIDENAVMWVGSRLPPEVHPHASVENDWVDDTAWSTFLPDGQEMQWQWFDDDFYAADGDGVFWSWAETKTWMDCQECLAMFPQEAKLEEIFAGFDERMRTFRESRALNNAKQMSRGYYPLSMMKGKNQAKGKGKGKGSFGKKGGSSASNHSVLTVAGKGTSKGQKPGSPEYRGCFICGSKEHDFRSCPKRQNSGNPHMSRTSSTNYYSRTIFMVMPEVDDAESLETIPITAEALAVMSQEFPGHAVIDSGATESIASFEALEEIMNMRFQRFGQEDLVVHSKQKRFKFGNGETKMAESFIELPQTLGGQSVRLGVHTLDAPGVPLLISVKTLTRLRAVVDFEDATICFKPMSSGRWIPLKRARNGHLLLDLTQDWLGDNKNFHSASNTAAVSNDSSDKSRVQYKVADSSAGIHMCESCTLSSPCHDSREVESHVLGICEGDPQVPQVMSTASSCENDVEKEDEELMSEQVHEQQFGDQKKQLEDASADSSSGSSMRLLPALVAAVISSTSSSTRYVSDPIVGDGSSQSIGQTESQGQAEKFTKPDTIGREIRLEPSRGSRSPRPSKPGLPLLGIPHTDAGGQRFTVGPKWSRPLASLRDMQTQNPVCACSRRKGDLQIGWSLGDRCCQGHGQNQGQGGEGACKPRSSEYQSDRDSWSQGIPESEIGQAGERRVQASGEGHPKQAFEPRLSESRGGGGSHQEGIQAGECEGSRSGGVGDLERCGNSSTINVSDQDSLKDPQRQGLLTDAMKEILLDKGMDYINEANHAYEETFGMDAEDRVDLLEICCPTDSKLVTTFQENGLKALRIGLPAFDLKTRKGLQELREMRLIRNGLIAAEDQIQLGGEVGWEWPKNNLGWKLPEVKRFFQKLERRQRHFIGKPDGCAYGLVNQENIPLRKPWRVSTTSQTLAQAVTRQCPGHEYHAECLGGEEARKSGFYPQSLCDVICKAVREMRNNTQQGIFPCCYPAMPVEDESHGKTSFQPLSDTEKKASMKLLDKLHRRTGHPSNQALAETLRHRGAHPEVIELTRHHVCPDCQELRLAPLNPMNSLEKSDTLWETVVLDNAEFPVDGKIIHAMLMIDEASRFLCPHFLFETAADESRNCTGTEAVKAIHDSWIRHYGMPALVRLDPEGAFRSTELSQWMEERGIEVQPCAAEAHGQIGVIERAIQTVKATVRQLLQGSGETPWEAIVQACHAHNEFSKLEGFSPFQWAFGRQPSMTGRLHSKEQDLPFWTSSAVQGTAMAQNLRLRVQAQQTFLRQQAQEHVSRALNSKTRRAEVFLPGDLIYFKRVKPPAQPQAAARMPHKLWRWYGPGRVLATETRNDGYGESRKPAHIIWIVSHGRLKRCSPEQLRHVSERERLLAESSEGVSTTWTFHSLAQTLYRGEYEILDQHVFPGDQEAKGPPRRSRSVGREVSSTPRQSSHVQPSTPAQSSHVQSGRSRSVDVTSKRTEKTRQNLEAATGGDRAHQETGVERMTLQELAEATSGERAHPKAGAKRTEKMPQESRKEAKKEVTNPSTPAAVSDSVPTSGARSLGLDLGRYLQDPMYDPAPDAVQRDRPMNELFSQPLFKKQRRELYGDDFFIGLCEEEVNQKTLDHAVCTFDIDLPTTAAQWKRFKRSPCNYFVKKVKGAEVKWHLLSPEGKKGFEEAKMAEVNQWLTAAAVKKAIGPIPKDRVIPMRWVLTYKQSGAPKGRIVLIGYKDPDLAELQSSAPTMSRRTRQLALQMMSVKCWRALKADVKAAFLQGDATETSRLLFAQPVPELAMAMGLKEGEIVQVMKSCYGLITAPARWFQCIAKTLKELGMHQCRSDPCLWVLHENDADGKRQVSGLICAHVDDFLIAGDEQSEAWTQLLHQFYDRFRWSPWEFQSFQHCGVQIREHADYSYTLDHSAFCENIEQVTYQNRPDHEPVNADELTQLRGALGALQWRAHQTAPHLAARLGQLQSELAKPTINTVKATNKLIRECFQTRHLSVRINQLDVSDPREVCFVGWSDAALANRIDMGSTGGYVIAAANPIIMQGQSSPLTLISWRSGKLARKARSSLAAEAQALSETDQELMFTRMAWAEMCGDLISLSEATEKIAAVRGTVVVDAKSLYDILLKRELNSSGVGLKDKYSTLEVLCLLESLEKMKTEVRWVHSEAQIADALTKPLPPGILHKIMHEGIWTLRYDPAFTSAEKLKASRRTHSLEDFRGVSANVHKGIMKQFESFQAGLKKLCFGRLPQHQFEKENMGIDTSMKHFTVGRAEKTVSVRGAELETSFHQSRDWFGIFYDDVYSPPKSFHMVVEWIACSSIHMVSFLNGLDKLAARHDFKLLRLPIGVLFPQPAPAWVWSSDQAASSRSQILPLLGLCFAAWGFASGDAFAKTILVTGAGGRTGSLVDILVAEDADYKVRALVHSEKSKRKLLEAYPKLSKENIYEQIVFEGSLRWLHGGGGGNLGCAKVEGMVPAALLAEEVDWKEARTNRFKKGKLRFSWKGDGKPEQVDWEGQRNQFDCAVEEGLQQVVLVGTMTGTQKDSFLNSIGEGSGDQIVMWKRKAEVYLIDLCKKSGKMKYTIIHAGGLSDNPGGKAPVKLGVDDKLRKVKNLRIPRADIAKACVQALDCDLAKDRSFDMSSIEGAEPLDPSKGLEKLLREMGDVSWPSSGMAFFAVLGALKETNFDRLPFYPRKRISIPASPLPREQLYARLLQAWLQPPLKFHFIFASPIQDFKAYPIVAEEDAKENTSAKKEVYQRLKGWVLCDQEGLCLATLREECIYFFQNHLQINSCRTRERMQAYVKKAERVSQQFFQITTEVRFEPPVVGCFVLIPGRDRPGPAIIVPFLKPFRLTSFKFFFLYLRNAHVPKRMKQHFISIAALLATAAATEPQKFRATKLRSLVHEGAPFTQGLELVDDDTLIETSGAFPPGTASFVRFIDLQTGTAKQKGTSGLDGRFAEGVARAKEGWLVTTWSDHKALRYGPNLDLVAEEDYPWQGWGFAHDTKQDKFLATDGSQYMMQLNAETLKLEEKKAVTCMGHEVAGMNELEYVEDFADQGPVLFGNIYLTRFVLGVDPETFQCKCFFDLEGFGVQPASERMGYHVANGIAYLPKSKSFIVTGKNWEEMFEISLEAETDPGSAEKLRKWLKGQTGKVLLQVPRSEGRTRRMRADLGHLQPGK
eukprot:s563_g26.t1